MAHAKIKNSTPRLIYDIECYKNFFCIVFYEPETERTRCFVSSPWQNDWKELRKFIKKCSAHNVTWVGFNNFFYDYPVIHHLYDTYSKNEDQIYAKAYDESKRIIGTPYDKRWENTIWPSDTITPQMDLYRIHHFDNMARATSLKALEIAMCADSVQDLPYNPDEEMTKAQADRVLDYCIHDVRMTAEFYEKTLDMIDFREELTQKYQRDFTNHNDTKIGKDYFIMELQDAGIECYKRTSRGRVAIQTPRPHIDIKDIIFPYVSFTRPEFSAILDWLNNKRIYGTKEVLTQIDDLGPVKEFANLTRVTGKYKNLNCIVDGFQFDFGTGGIHGSVPPTIVRECEEYAIIDFDVTSLYPSIAISNKLFPEHLGTKFCDIYEDMKKQRLSYEKGTPENAMLKLALNGVYGDSNSEFSPFYDPKYTMSITINGQLMLCMLAERHMEVPGLRLIQINTDGLTVQVPRRYIQQVENINAEWCDLTGLELERADYSRMFIRDVNNYIAEYTDGKLKRKGKYEYDVQWHQDPSNLVSRKAAEAHLVHGEDIETFIRNHDNPFDFMLRVKLNRTMRLESEHGEPFQRISRYYMATDGVQLVKVMAPLKGRKNERRQKINDGYFATVCNDFDGKLSNVDYQFYVDEARKLVDPMLDSLYDEFMG